jgi:hypothetical protein
LKGQIEQNVNHHLPAATPVVLDHGRVLHTGVGWGDKGT